MFLTWFHKKLCPFSKDDGIASIHTMKNKPTKTIPAAITYMATNIGYVI